jgi:hypothetical protein
LFLDVGERCGLEANRRSFPRSSATVVICDLSRGSVCLV